MRLQKFGHFGQPPIQTKPTRRSRSLRDESMGGFRVEMGQEFVEIWLIYGFPGEAKMLSKPDQSAVRYSTGQKRLKNRSRESTTRFGFANFA